MISILVILNWFFWGIFGVLKIPDDKAWCVLAGVMALALIIHAGVLFSLYYDHLVSQEGVVRLNDDKAVYEKRSKDLVDVFKTEMSKYVEHEKNIFDKISPGNISIYLAKYPELKANEVIVELVERISELKESVYDVELRINILKGDMRIHRRNPWIFFYPKRTKAENNKSKEA